MFTHQEAVKFVKTLLASYKINEYDCWERSWNTEHEYYYGSKNHHDSCRIWGLPAPYGIGHVLIDIYDAHISLRLVMCRWNKLNKEEQKLYKTDVIKVHDDIWVIDLPDNKMLSERWSDRCTGYNYGLPINERTINEFYKLFKIVFGTEYTTNLVVKLASKSYEENRQIAEFIELAAHAWYLDKNLWNCVNKFSTQWGEISQISLINQFNFD